MKTLTALITSGFHVGRNMRVKSGLAFALDAISRPLTEAGVVPGRSISSTTRQSQPLQHPKLSTEKERSTQAAESALRGINDRYRGVHVDLDQLPASCPPSRFASLLKASLNSWSQSDRSSAWIRVPIEKSQFIPEASRLGFRFHHAENDLCFLYLWLRKDVHSMLPPFATHQVGVAGCVVNKETKQVLVVKDKIQSHNLWKFPGGLAELNEDIDDTAKREVWEETGIRTNFLGVLAFRQQHQHPDAFGRSDLFYVCLMTPTTFDLRPCKEEIQVCRWITVDDLIKDNSTSAISKRCLQLVRYGLRSGFTTVTIGAEECRSLYKGKRMKLFTRSVAVGDDDSDFDLGDYPHDVTTGDQFNPHDVTTHDQMN